jgi:hypothetical protein
VVLATTSTKNHGATPCRFQMRQAATPMHGTAIFPALTSLLPSPRYSKGVPPYSSAHMNRLGPVRDRPCVKVTAQE